MTLITANKNKFVSLAPFADPHSPLSTTHIIFISFNVKLLMHKKYYFLAFFFLIFVLLFRNLGVFFDVTKPPSKADLIVSLGGDFNMERVQKSLELYEQNLSRSKQIILTGPNTLTTELPMGARAHYLMDHGVSNEKIIIVSDTKNTLAEIRFIKSYMLTHHLKHVLIVSYPPHARRISFFADTVFDYSSSGLTYTVVGTDKPWWDKQFYHFDAVALKFTINELFKYTYYQLRYRTGTLPTTPYPPISTH